MSIPRTTHQWLEPFYDVLDGRSQRPLQLGAATSYIGLYGASGGQRIASGTAGITGWTGAGSSSVTQIWFNGGTGSFYTVADITLALKNVGILKP